MTETALIKLQEITEEGGLVQGMYMTKAVAKSFAHTLASNIEKLKATSFADKLKQPSVKIYFEGLEDKLAQAERVANFHSKGKSKK